MKKISILIVALLVAVAASAQPQGGPRGGEGGARIVEMLQKSLSMTAEQAQKFAPIYLEYMRDLQQVNRETREYIDSFKNQEMTIKLAKKIMTAQLNGDKTIIQVKKEYIKVFMDYLTPDQLSKVFSINPGPGRPRHGRGTPTPHPSQPQNAPRN